MPSAFARFAMGLQAALLRRNWLGAMGDFVMVITTTGRRSGRQIATPIAYLRDGDSVLALTVLSVGSNWYRNLRARPEALLEIRGEPLRVRAEFVDDPPGQQAVVAKFRENLPGQFKRLIGVELAAPPAELAKAVSERAFVRFRPVGGAGPR